VCTCSDQAAHYHNLGPKLGASLLTRHIGWKTEKRERRRRSDHLEERILTDHFLMVSKLRARLANYKKNVEQELENTV
jgi:hypothetical protein